MTLVQVLEDGGASKVLAIPNVPAGEVVNDGGRLNVDGGKKYSLVAYLSDGSTIGK